MGGYCVVWNHTQKINLYIVVLHLFFNKLDACNVVSCMKVVVEEISTNVGVKYYFQKMNDNQNTFGNTISLRD